MELSQRRRAVLTQIAGWYILAGTAGLLLFTVPGPSWKDCRITGRHLICHPLRNEARMLRLHLSRDGSDSQDVDAILRGMVNRLGLSLIEAMEPAKGRRALVLLSDGADRDSRVSAGDLVDKARRRDVQVYPIAIGSPRPAVFAELASVTGGRSFFVKDPATLSPTLTAIAHELRFQYLLGYVPPHRPDASSWHAIDVTVGRSDAKVRARDGYFSR